MLPSFAPIGRKTLLYPFGAFCGGDKDAILSPSYEIPPAITPFVCFFDKEVGGKAKLYKRVRRTILILQLVCSFSFSYDRGVTTVSLIHLEYKAVFTAGTYFLTTVPRIPRYCFFNFCILHSLPRQILICLSHLPFQTASPSFPPTRDGIRFLWHCEQISNYTKRRSKTALSRDSKSR